MDVNNTRVFVLPARQARRTIRRSVVVNIQSLRLRYFIIEHWHDWSRALRQERHWIALRGSREDQGKWSLTTRSRSPDIVVRVSRHRCFSLSESYEWRIIRFFLTDDVCRESCWTRYRFYGTTSWSIHTLVMETRVGECYEYGVIGKIPLSRGVAHVVLSNVLEYIAVYSSVRSSHRICDVRHEHETHYSRFCNSQSDLTSWCKDSDTKCVDNPSPPSPVLLTVNVLLLHLWLNTWHQYQQSTPVIQLITLASVVTYVWFFSLWRSMSYVHSYQSNVDT